MHALGFVKHRLVDALDFVCGLPGSLVMKGTGYLTTREVAEKLGVTVGRVQQFIAEGRLPSIKVGRDRFILESDLVLLSGRKTGRPPKDKSETGSKGSKKRSRKK